MHESSQFIKEFKARCDLKDQNYYFAYRVLQTPTIRLVLPLVRDETCRVIRKFDNKKDFLIRVSFTNEKGDKDHYSSKKMHLLVDEQIKNRLQKGLKIGETHFLHFGQSNSQIKQKSFWFLDNALGNKNELLNEMGTFDKETIPLKKMARQGQLFSGTKAITKLEQAEKDEIPDIEIERIVEGEKVKYCFTDGIGNISGALATLIDKKYELT